MKELIPCLIDWKIHSNQKVAVSGVVVSRTTPAPKIIEGVFKCRNCKETENVVYDPFDLYDDPNTREPDTFCCEKSAFKLQQGECKFINFARLTLRDPFEQTSGVPAEVEVHVVDENAKLQKIRPGDRIKISGILRVKLLKAGLTVRYLAGEQVEYSRHNIKVGSKSKTVARKLIETYGVDGIKEMLFPKIYGFDDLKEGSLLQQVSQGAYTETEEGIERRYLNILAVGDPGIAKSKLFNRLLKLFGQLGWAYKTSGAGSTDVGLTAAAVKNKDESWSLIAGPLVLGDGHVLMIDELDKAKQEFPSLTQAFEGTFPLSKAGITAELFTRTAVLAGQNTVGGYVNPNLRLIDQVKIPQTLLERFDLIFTLIDEPSESTDRIVARYTAERIWDNSNEERDAGESKNVDEALVSYFAAANSLMRDGVEISPELTKKIEDKYRQLRETQDFPQDLLDKFGRKIPPVSARAVESLARLTQAYAAANLRTTATENDLEAAFTLYSKSVKRALFDPVSGKLVPLHQSRSAKGAQIVVELLKGSAEKLTLPQIFEFTRAKSGLTPDEHSFIFGTEADIRRNWKFRRIIEEVRENPNVMATEEHPLALYYIDSSASRASPASQPSQSGESCDVREAREGKVSIGKTLGERIQESVKWLSDKRNLDGDGFADTPKLQKIFGPDIIQVLTKGNYSLSGHPTQLNKVKLVIGG